jgi:hypothetical protein
VDADVIDAAIAAVVAGDGEEELPPPEKKEMKKKIKGEKRKRPDPTEQADGKIFLRYNLSYYVIYAEQDTNFPKRPSSRLHLPPSYNCYALYYCLFLFSSLLCVAFTIISSPLPQHISCFY